MEAAAKTAENYQAQVDRKRRELAAGLCTETDLLQAQKNLLSAQTALQSTTDQANKALRQLAILLGKSGTSITLGKIPAVSATELASMNLDADRAAAVVASSSVKSARRSSATGDAARKLRHQQIEEAESAASASADEQYAEIAALSLELTRRRQPTSLPKKHTAPPRLSISPVRLIKQRIYRVRRLICRKKQN